MYDCAYGSNSPLDQWGSVKISGCDYGSSSPLGQVMSIAKAFLFLLRVRLVNKSRLILVGAAVSFVRALATATVVVVFSTVVRVMADMSTELPHRTLQGPPPGNRTKDDHDRGRGQYPDETDICSNKNQPGLVRQSYSEKKQKGLGD